MTAIRIVTIAFWGTVIPPVLTFLVWVYGLHLEPGQLVNAVSFRVYAAFSLGCLLVISLRALLDRSLRQALVYAGFLLILVQGVVWYGFRFSGMAAVGDDEQIVDYYRAEPGAFVTPPRLPLRTSRVTETPPGLTLVKDSTETRLEPGKSQVRDGYSFRLESVERAPLVSVQSARGELVDEAYLKLTTGGETGDFVMFGRLPHRFYVREVKEHNGTSPGFRIWIVRDKITIVDRTVSAGESVYFDGHFVTCRPGAPWARLAVEKQQSKLLFVAGLGLLGTALVMALAARRKVRP